MIHDSTRLKFHTVVQVTATVACRELGFDRGFFQDVESVPADVNLPPPWLARIPCRRLEDSLLDCGPLNFGSARECGLPQRLECTNGTGAQRATRMTLNMHVVCCSCTGSDSR